MYKVIQYFNAHKPIYKQKPIKHQRSKTKLDKSLCVIKKND